MFTIFCFQFQTAIEIFHFDINYGRDLLLQQVKYKIYYQGLNYHVEPDCTVQ